MHKITILSLVSLLLILAFIVPVIAIDPALFSNKDSLVRSQKESGGFDGNAFMIAYEGAQRNSIYDVYFNDGDVSGIIPPTLLVKETLLAHTNVTTISAGHFQMSIGDLTAGIIYFATNSQTTPMIYTIKVVDPTGKVPPAQTTVKILAVAPTPTPIPTPSIGNIVVQSSPAGATIFLDNAIKGITPLTINSVPNGAHVVLLRLDGYQDSSSSINVLGDTQTINPTFTPKTTTIGATTIPTTVSVTTTTTIGAIITELTTTGTTATPEPTATVNYSATIAAMQSQIAEQNAKITEQGNILDQITHFLRNVFGWK
ncbi:MAG: PEGA domain-containing protein [Methanoregula sp.]|nr:PEGA domain-containing protein [Methanoregula sp.]